MHLTIVKLGGSVITDKRRRFALRPGTVRRLARELAAADGEMVLVHGGGSFGHPLARLYGIAEGYSNERQLMGFSLTHRAMERLNARLIEALQGAGVPAAAIQPSACALVRNGRIERMELRPLRALLELGILPVLYGDVVPDLRKGMSVLSGDQIAVYLARELGASRVIMGTDVDGVYRVDPKTKRKELVRMITPATWREFSGCIGAALGENVTLGMAGKVEELISLIESGVDAEIINAAKRGIVRRALLGERGLGTVICSR